MEVKEDIDKKRGAPKGKEEEDEEVEVKEGIEKKRGAPKLEVQREEIHTLLNQRLQKGDIWYVKYVGRVGKETKGR